MGRLFEDILSFDEACAETQDKPQNMSQASGGKAPLVTLRVFPAFHFTCLPIVKANPAVGRNCFQMTLWERKTHFIKKLQKKSRACTLHGPGFHMDYFLILCNKPAPGVIIRRVQMFPALESGAQSWDWTWQNLGKIT